MGVTYPNYVRKVGSNVIMSHTLGSTPYINLAPASNFYFDHPANKEARISSASSNYFSIGLVGNDAVLYTKLSNANLKIDTAGSGRLQFGTYAATGDVACNGNILIYDEAGNSRKLMTTA